MVLHYLDFLDGTFSFLNKRRIFSVAGDPQHRVRDFDQVAKYLIRGKGFPCPQVPYFPD